ncbi:hypothetical protein D3C79_1073940 [compost metagenome]
MHIQAGNALKARAQGIQFHIQLHGRMKNGAHAGTHDFRIVRINAAGTEQAAKVPEPR